MLVVAQRPVGLTSLPFDSHRGEEASALAVAYLQWASACWRGDWRAPLFAGRLGAYWHPELPPMPTGAPDAISPHGGGGRGIHWYETGDEIRGYVPGAHGGYQVPVAAVPQLARCITDDPAVTRGDDMQRHETAEFEPPTAPKNLDDQILVPLAGSATAGKDAARRGCAAVVR